MNIPQTSACSTTPFSWTSWLTDEMRCKNILIHSFGFFTELNWLVELKLNRFYPNGIYGLWRIIRTEYSPMTCTGQAQSACKRCYLTKNSRSAKKTNKGTEQDNYNDNAYAATLLWSIQWRYSITKETIPSEPNIMNNMVLQFLFQLLQLNHLPHTVVL